MLIAAIPIQLDEKSGKDASDLIVALFAIIWLLSICWGIYVLTRKKRLERKRRQRR